MTENCYIEKDDDGTKIFRHTILGVTRSFNVDYLSDKDNQWFCDVVGGIMDDIHIEAITTGQNNIKMGIRAILDI